MQRDQAQHQAAIKVTWIGAVANLLLGLCKIIIGTLAHSAALIADGIHSLSDLITDLMVALILRITKKGPDEDHPWGHGQFETLGTVILGSILIAVAGAMVFESSGQLINNQSFQMPEWPALLVASLSIACKEWIYRYTLKIGQQVNSELLIANAWHSRTDAISSVVVLIGVTGAMSGIPWLDSAAAILVAFMVAKIGWDLSWNSLKQLVDTALPAEQIKHYTQQITSVEGIHNVHDFKSRTIGSQKLLEIHIQISPGLTASEGHRIGELACRKLRNDNDISHIIYHIDTYDDTHLKNQCLKLPNRSEIEPLVLKFLDENTPELSLYRLILHYNVNNIDIELLLSPNDPNDMGEKGYTCCQLNNRLRIFLSDSSKRTDWLGKLYLAVGSNK